MVFSAAQTAAFLRGRVRVLEKLDGLNVGVLCAPDGSPRLVSRGHGVLRSQQLGPGLWPLVDWAWTHWRVLAALLGERYVLYGEWISGPSRLAYPRRKTDFLAFALFDRARRRFLRGPLARARLERAGFDTPPIRFEGRVGSVAELASRWSRSEFGGEAEGVVVERADGGQAKVVRAQWLRRPARLPGPLAGAPRPPVAAGTWWKTFPPGREADCALEQQVLRAIRGTGVGPGLRAARPLALQLTRLEGARWPEHASARLSFALGQQLGRLHAVAPGAPARSGLAFAQGQQQGRVHAVAGGAPARSGLVFALGQRLGRVHVAAPALAGLPSEHLARVAPGPLAKFLRAQERGLKRVTPVLCHGDLKPENLLVARGGVWLIDFERAVLADPAWELACAMDRLRLTAPARYALLEGWTSTFGADPQLAHRAQLFRIAWREILPHAVAALERETGRKPSARAWRLAR